MGGGKWRGITLLIFVFEISIINKSFKLIFTRHKGQGRTTGRRGSKPRGKKGKDGWQSSPPGAGKCAPHWPRVLTSTSPKAPGFLQTKAAWTCPQKASLHSPLALEAEGAKVLYKTCPHFPPGLHNLSLKMTTQRWHRGCNLSACLVNKVSLVHGRTHSFPFCRWLLYSLWPAKLKIFPLWPFTVRNICGPSASMTPGMKTHQQPHGKRSTLYFSDALCESPWKQGAQLPLRDEF